MIEFEIPIEPTGQQRPRFSRYHKRAYKAKSQKQNEKDLLSLIRPFAPTRPMTGPVLITIVAKLSIPKSFSKKKIEQIKKLSLWPTKKPDLDNITKQVFDVMNNLFFEDDKQVVGLFFFKKYSDNPGYHIIIQEVA